VQCFCKIGTIEWAKSIGTPPAGDCAVAGAGAAEKQAERSKAHVNRAVRAEDFIGTDKKMETNQKTLAI
jgi:hypothetical protein